MFFSAEPLQHIFVVLRSAVVDAEVVDACFVCLSMPISHGAQAFVVIDDFELLRGGSN